MAGLNYGSSYVRNKKMKNDSEGVHLAPLTNKYIVRVFKNVRGSGLRLTTLCQRETKEEALQAYNQYLETNPH